jgi:hypothetical protein
METLKSIAGTDTRIRCVCHCYNLVVKAVMAPLAKGVSLDDDDDFDVDNENEDDGDEEEEVAEEDVESGKGDEENADDVRLAQELDDLEEDHRLLDEEVNPGLDAEDEAYISGDKIIEDIRSMTS